MAALSPGARRLLASPWVVVVGLLAFLASQYAWALAVPFINDDFIFLDKTRAISFGAVWAPRDLLFHYYRPWSRELHYWVIQRLCGAREVPFHLASGALWLAVMGLYDSVARRLLALPAATGATAAVAALGAWTVPLVWPAGAQDGWMLLWALLFLRAVMAGADTRAALALVLALLSKETAVVLPAIGLAYLRLVARIKWRTALRRTAAHWALVLVWAAFHPLVGGRLWSPVAPGGDAGIHPSIATQVIDTLGALFNLYPFPAPESGWGQSLRQGLVGALLLAGMWACVGATGRIGPRGGAHAQPLPQARHLTAFGLWWAALAWLPLGMPTIAWRSHYTLLGALGAWLVLACWLSRIRFAMPAVVVALALLRPASGDTVSHDWSTEWYRRRAAEFVAHLRDDLRTLEPRFPAHARAFFVRVPSDVGFLAGNGPALRVWYSEPTLRGGFYTSYRPRGPAEPRGPDYFFRFDSTAGWVEVVAGAEDVARARAANPRWEKDHATLAVTLASGGGWRDAATEYVKLAEAAPAHVDYAYDAGVCFESSGDSTAAARWYARASALPGAAPDVRQAAARLAPYLRGPR